MYIQYIFLKYFYISTPFRESGNVTWMFKTCITIVHWRYLIFFTYFPKTLKNCHVLTNYENASIFSKLLLFIKNSQ